MPEEDEDRELSAEEAVAYREGLVSERKSEDKNADNEDDDFIPADAKNKDEREEVIPEKKTELDPSLKAALDQINNLSYRLKQAEGRLGSVQNAVQNANSAAEKAALTAKAAPTMEQVAAAAKTDEEWEEAKTNFPELEILERRMKASKEDKKDIPDVAAIRAELETDFSKKLTETQQAFETRLLDISRKGWRETAKSPEMKAWIEQQDEAVKDKYYKSNKADDAIEVLDAFNASREQQSESVIEKRGKRLSRSLSVKGKGQQLKVKSEEDMTDDEYRQYLSRKRK